MGIRHDLILLIERKSGDEKKKLRWARYVACLGKRWVQVSEEKCDGKRHVENVEVDGGRHRSGWWKRLTAKKRDNSTLPLLSKTDWGTWSTPCPCPFYPRSRLSVRNSRCAGLRKISTPLSPPRGPITNRSARRQTDYPIRITKRRWEDNIKMTLKKKKNKDRRHG